MKKALIVVDVQNDFCIGGALEVKKGNKVIPVINQLVKKGKFNYIIATQDWHPSNHKSFASNHKGYEIHETINLNGIVQVLWPDHCIQRTKGARFHSELNLGQDYKVFKKGKDPEIDSYSGFYDNDHQSSTGLSGFLKKNRIASTYICGLATDYCVKFTAMDSKKEGFNTYVIRDAVQGVNVNKDDAKIAFKEMKENGIKLVTSNQILSK